MRALDLSEFIRLADVGKGHEVMHVVLISPTRVHVLDVSKPLDVERHIGQELKLPRG